MGIPAYQPLAGLSTYALGDPVPPSWGQTVDQDLQAIWLGPEYWLLTGAAGTYPVGIANPLLTAVRNNPNGAAPVFTSGEQLVVGATGLYLVTLQVTWGGIGGAYVSPEQVASGVQVVGGSLLCQDSRGVLAGNTPASCVTSLAELAAGAVLKVTIINETGAAQPINSIVLVGRQIGGII